MRATPRPTSRHDTDNHCSHRRHSRPPQIQKMSSRFAPVDIRVDTSTLPDNERQALVRIIQAAQVLDGLFLQAGVREKRIPPAAPAERHQPLGKARLSYFLVNKGPWSALDDNAPFLPGVEAKPPQANFYPADATRAEVEAWMNALPQAEKEAATGFFSTIRRNPAGKLVAVPYSQEYQGELMEMARLLREAASLTRAADLEVVPGEARRRLHQQRLLRKRRRLDGAEFIHRTDHRAVRGLRG